MCNDEGVLEEKTRLTTPMYTDRRELIGYGRGYLRRVMGNVRRLVCQFRWVGQPTIRISAQPLDGAELGFTEFLQKT